MTIRSMFKLSTRLVAILAAGLVLLAAAGSAEARGGGSRGGQTAAFHAPSGIARIPSGAFKAVNPPHRLPPCPAHHIGVCH